MSLLPLGLISQGGSANGGGAFELISTQVLASSASSVTFSSISSTYKHLQLRFTAKSASAGGDNLRMQFNSDTANNYAVHYLTGSGSSVASGNAVPWNTALYAQMPSAAHTTDAFGAGIIDILDYGSTNKNKTIRNISGSASTFNIIALTSGVWLNTAVITSLNVYMGTGSNIIAGSRFSLYGIRGA